MTAFRLVMWVEVRRRWRALASLALLLGLVGGVVLGAAAGARRTDSAYPRLLASANASQLTIVPQGTGLNGYYTALARLPQAAAVAPVEFYNAGLPPGYRAAAGLLVQAIASPDDSYGTTVDRVKLLAGQMFGPREPGAVVINQQLADIEHLSPGGTLRLDFVPTDPSTGNDDLSKEVILSFRVSGIALFDNQVVSTGANAGEPTVLLSPPFIATAARSVWCCDEATVRLRPGADEAQFITAANQLAKRYAGSRQQPGTGGQLDIVNSADQVSATQRAIRPQAVALALFAALAALIALAVLSQLLARQLALDAAQYPALRVLGVTRPVLLVVSLARLALVSGAGAVLAVAIAVAGSPLMPIGPARLADPSPGLSADPLVLGVGFAAIALLPVLILARSAWRAAARAAGPTGAPLIPGRASAIAAALSRWGSVTGGVGVRMAFEPGRGNTAVPVRSVLAGTIVAVGAIAGALVFGASLVGLVGTPHQYGQNWDAELDLKFGAVPGKAAGQLLRSDVALTGYTGGDYGLVAVEGTLVAAIGLDPQAPGGPGGGYVTVLAGRAPTGPGEIALGAKTMSAAHVRIGQDIPVMVNHTTVTGPPTRRIMRVVGEVILPAFSRGGFSPTDLGTGALLAASVLSEPATGCPASGTCYNFFLLRYRPGTNEAAEAAALTTLATRSGCPPGACTVTSDQRPGDIRDYTYVRDTPLVLGALLAVLAVGTLAHVLQTGVRRRRRDLAVLKALGLSRGQVLRLVAWQAGAFGFAALLVGLPAGILAGRQAWAAFAAAAGIAPSPDIPLALILLTIPATLLVAMLISVWPGWRAARLRPAAVLWTQ